MKLNTKIIISYVIITLSPIILALVLGVVFLNYQIGRIESRYGIECTINECFFNQSNMMNKMTAEIHRKLKTVKSEGKEYLRDEDFLESVNDSLKEKYSYLLVREDSVFTYKGVTAEENEDLNDIISYIKRTKIGDNNGVTLYYSNQEKEMDQYLIKVETYKTADNIDAAFYIVTNISNSITEIKTLMFQIVILSICITILVGTVLTWWIYRSVVLPVKKLNNGIRKISRGKLDFEIATDEKNEFGQLFNSFDKMRLHLKNSIDRQLANEEENKELISNISHDLKTPLTAIKGYVEGIMDGVADNPEKMDKYIKTIYNKANDMDKLIEELSLFSKLDSNSIPYNFAKLDINQYFSECIEEIKVELESKNIKLSYINGLPEKQYVMADREQLKRVINNVISNSIKYMDKEESRILIRLDEDDEDDDSIRVAIKDNGRGVKEEELDLIFKRFYRADSSRNSAQGGSGIGLAVVKKIIEDHGGRIWATGIEKQGLTINFTLTKMKSSSNN